MTILPVDQRTEAWRLARLGRLTGSRAKDMLATIKSGEAAARRDYRWDLVCERLTGLPAEDGFVSKDMQRGIALEPLAFARYEALTGCLVRRTGFVVHDEYLAGCSLDGDVDGCTGVVELKCPRTANHVKAIRGGCVPSEHLAQLRHNVWVSGAAWADFVSFDDRVPVNLQMFRVRVYRDVLNIDAYEDDALTFLDHVANEEQALRTMANPSAVMAAAVEARA